MRADYRKITIWNILAPYLITKRKLSEDEAYSIIREWIDTWDKIKKLDFNPSQRIRLALRGARHFLPISREKLKFDNQGFYNLLQDSGVLK